MATTTMGTVTKPKRRNSEKRKEKSRNAARCRRGKETEIFYELAHELPMSHSMCAQLDKAGIMRLILSYLKIKKLIPTVHNIKQEVNEDEDDGLLSMDQVIDSCYQKALEGFVLILSHEGDIIYLSDNVSKYLGLKQTDLMGQSIYDYAHPCDHEEIREQLSSRHLSVPDGGSSKNCKHKRRHHHDFLVRLKCTLTPRGKKVNLKSAVYKVIQCSGHVQTAPSETIMGYRMPPMPCLVMIASPIHHPANIEIPLDGQTFLTRHSMDMKFTYCDDRIKELLGYESKNLVGRSMHEFYHALDNAAIEKCHRDLFAKGQTRTGSYRFLAKEGGYAWVQTEATIIYSNKTNKPQCVVCVNYCLSSIEEDGLILSVDQKPCDTDNDIKLSTENVFAPISITTTSEDAEELKFWLTTDKTCEEEEEEVEEEKESAEKLSCLAPVAGEELLDIISRFQGDTQQAEQAAEADEELLDVARMSLKDTGEQPMFVPFDPFAPLSSDNKLATIEELAVEIEKDPTKQDGYYTPPPPSQANLATDAILTGNNDPLMPDSRPPLKEKRLELGQIAPDDLELRAPYIPMEEDFELGSEAGEISTPFNNMADTWVPVDPFGQNTNNVENQFPNLCPSPLRSSTLTLPQMSPLNTPIPSPAALPASPATLSSPSHSPGGSLSSSLNRSLPNLCSPPMSLASTPPPINLPVSSPQPINLPVSSPQQMNFKAVPPAQQPSVPLITQNTLVGARPPLAVPQVRSVVLLSPGTVPTQTISCEKPVLTDRVTGNRPTGLMSMLKRKLGSQQDEAPSCKASKNLAGMKVMRRVDPWPPEKCTPAPSDPPLFMREPNRGLTSLLLQPQHQVSGIGDNGSFAQFLHKFALNVSNQNPRGGVKDGSGDGSLFIQLNPIQGTEPVKETGERAEMQRRSSLPLIDTQDAEVNAPVQSLGGLLQGEDLLLALDQTINRVPSQVDFRKFQE